jgi:hypothetical protein
MWKTLNSSEQPQENKQNIFVDSTRETLHPVENRERGTNKEYLFYMKSKSGAKV